MLRIEPNDDDLLGLKGQRIQSEMSSDVVYLLDAELPRRERDAAFIARRCGPDGQVPVLMKVLRPSFVKDIGPNAAVVVRKEAVALGRLNERVPPTPFVVRLIDTGSLQVDRGGAVIELPWIATELVHGGALGSTLSQRVQQCIQRSGAAFDPDRAAHAMSCIAEGLAAVHEVGVIHRDLSPDVVLCTGAGPDEVFKISDFSMARPQGFSGTLSGAPIGTPGYAPPELASLDADRTGTASDVFSLAATIFFMLSGEKLFNTASDVMAAVDSPKRRSLLDTQFLCPELRAKEPACRSIDLVISWATSGAPEARLTEALAVTAMISPHLMGGDAIRPSLRAQLLSRPPDAASPVDEWQWTKLHQPGTGCVFRSVAWDGYGRSIAATNQGLKFWNGTAWEPASEQGVGSSDGIRFVRRVAAGQWLVGGDGDALLVYTTGGVTERIPGPPVASARGEGQPRGGCELIDGDLEDVAVVVAISPEGQPHLSTHMMRRWLKPMPLDGVAAVTSLSRVDDARWLVTGRRSAGGAYAALFNALDWDLQELPAPAEQRVLLASAGAPRRGVGIAVGPGGTVIVWRDGQTAVEAIEGQPLLQAAGIDPFGRFWAAGPGQVWIRLDTGWKCLWREPDWQVPMVSLYLDSGLVFAMTADGGVVEGRAAQSR